MEQEHKQQNEDQGNTQEIDQEECDSECDATVQDNKIKERPETQNVKLHTPFGDVDYRPELKLSRASIVQLLVCYTERLNTQKATDDNKWQELAYPKLLKMFTDLRDHVTKIVSELCSNDDLDKDVVTINFRGYEGGKLPVIVQTQGVHHRATYGTVNVRPFLKTLEQRLTYLSTVDVPARYKGDEKKVNTFKRVQQVAKELLENHVQPLYNSWKLLCQEAADHAGIKMEEHHEPERRGYQERRQNNTHRHSGVRRQAYRPKRAPRNDGDNERHNREHDGGFVRVRGRRQQRSRQPYRGKYASGNNQ